jgi:predicted HTH transcriptional regulator
MSSEKSLISAVEVEQLINSSESEGLEFEAELNDKGQAARLIAAMANSGGGKIVLGAEEGKAVGLKSPDETSRIAKQGAQSVEPEVPITLHEVQVDGSSVVVAEVDSAGDRDLHVPPDGGLVKRAADGQDLPVSEQDLISAFAQNERAPTPSEEQFAKQLAKVNQELLGALEKGFDDLKRASSWRGQWRGWVISAFLGAAISLALTLIFGP